MVIENKILKAEFLPDIGGKMITLANVETGHQFLLESQLPGKHYKRAEYGTGFEEYDASGFDECFPTIEASVYRSWNTSGCQHTFDFPDHGELWSRPWEFRVEDNALDFSIQGVNAHYQLEKKITIEDNRLIIHYILTNFMDDPFLHLWSAHPLLKVSPASKIILPEDIDHVILSWVSDEKIGKREERVPWPFLSAAHEVRDYSIVQERSLGMAVKCFTDILHDGFAGLYDIKTSQSLLFEFDPKEIPYLGIWLCYGGWPAGAKEKHLTVALEPCTGRSDSLRKAVEKHGCAIVEPKSVKEWRLEISLWQGLPSLQRTSVRFKQSSFSVA